MGDLHVIVSTHTARHLGTVLRALADQSRPPDLVVVTCDTDDGAILTEAEDSAGSLAGRLTVVQRGFTGKSRSSQVRNNGVRQLLADGAAANAVLVFLDGDCAPARTSIAEHERLCQSGTLVIGFRHDLDQAQTEALRTGLGDMSVSPEQRAALAVRERRYKRQALLRRFGLAKPHKPKLLSANFSVRLAEYATVNGFDERYEGYGQEDDDLGRRLYATGCRPRIALSETITYHQYHPTRAPGKWHASPNAGLFASGGPVRCVLGLDNPAAQPALVVRRIGAASGALSSGAS